MAFTPQVARPPLVHQLAALVRLVREISSARDAREIYDPALAALQVIVGVDRSAIVLLDHRGVARFAASRGLSDGYRAAAEGHIPWSIDDPSPQAIFVRDIEQEPLVVPLLPALRAEQIRALAFIPLIYRGHLVGKFMLYFDRPKVLVAEDVELTNAVAYLVAFAIERARLYAELKESDRRKDTFLATLAHELRNPLAPAASALAILAERPDDPRLLHKVYDILDRSIGHIVKLVDDLLDVSRITRGLIKIEKQPIDLTSIVHHAIAPVEALIASQRQDLTLSLEPLWLEADALRVEQVITNLVHNAVKYTPAGGHIRVSTRAKDGGVEIRVRDDGIGIEPGVLPRLFDLFVQVDKSLARTRGGLGIGLTIVHELVERHGGTVIAESAGEGRGSEFTVWLPGRIDARRQVLPTLSGRPRGPHRRVLVVDDNDDAASMLAMVLEGWGHEVSIAEDGRAAIAAVAEQHPEVVLLDLGLPGMSGYQVATHLRNSGERDLRIVAVSGYGQPEDVARARAAGCDAHLAKPVDLEALEGLLADLPSPAGTRPADAVH